MQLLSKENIVIFILLSIFISILFYTPTNDVEVDKSLFDISTEADVGLLQDLADLSNYRNVDYIVLHCTASAYGKDLTEDNLNNIWRSYGWRNPGYHAVINLQGDIIWQGDIECKGLKPSNWRNGVRGFNTRSIHLSYVGGIDKKGKPLDTRTPAQKAVQESLVDVLKEIYPNAKVVGHKDLYSGKACPSHDVIGKF